MGPPAAAADLTGPSWSLSEEYPALDSPELAADLAEATRLVDRLEALCAERVAPHLAAAGTMTVDEVRSGGLLDALVEADVLRWASRRLLANVGTYASCTASVDGRDEAAKKLVARVSEAFARHSRAGKAAALFLDAATDEVAAAFLGTNDATAASAFLLGHSRRMREHTLPLAEEQLLSSLSVPGITAWGALYTDLSRTLTVRLEGGSDAGDGGPGRLMGVAAAAGLLDSPDAAERRRAWHGIRDAWLPHTETCTAILNALTGWRAETASRRRLGHYLDTPLHQNRMSRRSLDALWGAVSARGTAVGRRALRVQAAALGVPRMEPWDLLAPAPVRGGGAPPARVYPFEEGVELIADAVGRVDPEAGAFVRMMRDRGWIEASRGDAKQPGAYCTGFAKSRTPRVYLSEYNGRAPLLLTLAHELGHAWHSWVMREMPEQETQYSTILAETASIFFETVVAAELMAQAATPEERFAIQWGNAESAAGFFLNIPARFTFEATLNEKRAGGKLSPTDMDAAMVDAWRHHYGDDALGSLDLVGIFYASKLHFHLSSLAFYNFPYSFGYLFSLGVYARRAAAPSRPAFADQYRGLLRDTGRMSAEAVVEKHLGGRIDEERFWLDAIALVERQVEDFAATAAELGYAPPA